MNSRRWSSSPDSCTHEASEGPSASSRRDCTASASVVPFGSGTAARMRVLQAPLERMSLRQEAGVLLPRRVDAAHAPVPDLLEDEERDRLVLGVRRLDLRRASRRWRAGQRREQVVAELAARRGQAGGAGGGQGWCVLHRGSLREVWGRRATRATGGDEAGGRCVHPVRHRSLPRPVPFMHPCVRRPAGTRGGGRGCDPWCAGPSAGFAARPHRFGRVRWGRSEPCHHPQACTRSRPSCPSAPRRRGGRSPIPRPTRRGWSGRSRSARSTRTGPHRGRRSAIGSGWEDRSPRTTARPCWRSTRPVARPRGPRPTVRAGARRDRGPGPGRPLRGGDEGGDDAASAPAHTVRPAADHGSQPQVPPAPPRHVPRPPD